MCVLSPAPPHENRGALRQNLTNGVSAIRLALGYFFALKYLRWRERGVFLLGTLDGPGKVELTQIDQFGMCVAQPCWIQLFPQVRRAQVLVEDTCPSP